jgi:hypothetical protein
MTIPLTQEELEQALERELENTRPLQEPLVPYEDAFLVGEGMPLEGVLPGDMEPFLEEVPAFVEEDLVPPVDEAALREEERTRKEAMRATYGSDFPLALDTEPREDDWVSWIKGRWDAHRAGVQDSIYDAERNRLFRRGIQWISSTANKGAWREPPMPKDAVRAVDNQIGPALDWALQVLSEQRPGFRFSPVNPDPDRQRKAQAMQIAIEYQYHRQKMRGKLMEAAYHAQTDGSSFLLTYWDAEAGPWEELVPGRGQRPIGDVATKVYTIDQVRVSAEATATQKPLYWVLRDVLPLSQAVHLYGPEVSEQDDEYFVGDQVFNADGYRFASSPLYQDQRTVDRYTIFCDKCEYLPEGLTCIAVGNKMVFGPAELVSGRVPVVRITDGSADPGFFPRPRMNEWIAPQMRVNMILSKWIESVRLNSGGRFVSKTGAIVSETFVGGQTSVIEVRGSAPIQETLQPIQGFSLGNDAKELLKLETKKLEDRSGWNDNARGQYSSDQSGRAILAIREQLERTFAPFVYAASEAMSAWAECTVAWMRWGYQMPRMIGVIGGNRPDLAREFSAVDFDEVVDVFCDPETLMPMPRALRLYLLDQDLERGIIDQKEYRRRRPMAYLAESSHPDDIQEAKAKRVAEQIRMGAQEELIEWQDNEAIHQDVLERDLILAGDIPPEVRERAKMRWGALANQAAAKQGPPPAPQGAPAPGAPQGGAPRKQGGISPMQAEQAPTFGSNPPIAAAPPTAMGPGGSIPQNAAPVQ